MQRGHKELSGQGVRETSSTQMDRIGSIAETIDGRVYRYAKAGASDLVAGNLQVNADLVANHTNIVVAAAVAAGEKVVTATLGATATTADQYKGGFLTVNDATGEGITYRIASHSVTSSSGVVTVTLDEPITVALTTSSEVTLKKNPYSAVVISATDQADLPVGVPNVAVTAAYYAWIQTIGECSVLADNSTMTKGLELTISAATAGAVGLKDAAGEVKVGVASEALVSTENRSVYLTMV